VPYPCVKFKDDLGYVRFSSIAHGLPYAAPNLFTSLDTLRMESYRDEANLREIQVVHLMQGTIPDMDYHLWGRSLVPMDVAIEARGRPRDHEDICNGAACCSMRDDA
jgi:hypothetical protein